MTEVQEQAIISEVRHGDHEQYRFLVERYHRGLIQHLYNFIRDEQTAEDVAQEAFLRAYTKLALYNEAYAFSTWLYKIADNIAFRHVKQTKSTKDIAEIEETIADNQLPLDEMMDRSFTQQAVRDAVATLPIAYQQVITLYYWDDRSYEEIAAIIDRPIGTVRSLLHRAKQQLRKELYGQI